MALPPTLKVVRFAQGQACLNAQAGTGVERERVSARGVESRVQRGARRAATIACMWSLRGVEGGAGGALVSPLPMYVALTNILQNTVPAGGLLSADRVWRLR